MPTWDGFLVYVLRYLSDGAVRALSDIRKGVADLTGLTTDQRAELLNSGQSRADNRIGWAASYLNRVGAIERPVRGKYRITPEGTSLLARRPDRVTESDLRAMAKPGDEWWTGSQSKAASTAVLSEPEPDAEQLDPVEQIEEGLERIHKAVAADLLARLQGKDPTFFEAAVVKLLVAMGYGGADGKATVTQQSNDGGIDGVIDRDALGLDRIYVQAKRYSGTNAVHAPAVQAFVGALSGKASSGVFITTGTFSNGALDYARTAHTRVILIDGQRLTDLMIRYGVGVQNQRTLHVVAVDEDFFE
jgi:restriction system protein